MQHLWLGTLDGFLRKKMEGFMSHLNFLKDDGLQWESGKLSLRVGNKERFKLLGF